MPPAHAPQGATERGVHVTTLGPVRFRQLRYRCGQCGAKCYRHDERLCFLGHAVSWPLPQVGGRLAALLGSFEQARDALAEDNGVRLAKQTVADVTEAAGGAALRLEDEHRHQGAGRQAPLLDSPLTPDTACVFADGTTVHTEGNWHEIRVATATAAGAAGEPLARQSRARFLPVANFAWLLVLLARGVGYKNARLRAFVADGAHWLWKLAEDYFPRAAGPGLVPPVGACPQSGRGRVPGGGRARARQWAEARKAELSEGRVTDALAVAEREARRVRSPATWLALRELRTYLKNNRGRVDYPALSGAGAAVRQRPRGGAVQEPGGARCKQAGMRNWTYASVEAVRHLRAAFQDNSGPAGICHQKASATRLLVPSVCAMAVALGSAQRCVEGASEMRAQGNRKIAGSADC